MLTQTIIMIAVFAFVCFVFYLIGMDAGIQKEKNRHH